MGKTTVTETAAAKVIRFQHKFFSSMEQAYFRLSEQQPDLPVMVVPLGDNEVALPFDGIRKEFGLQKGEADDEMLDLVAQGLNFVVLLRPGDPIPAELLTGAPSDAVSPDYRQIALQRLTLQLVTWHAGEETLVTDRAKLARITENTDTKQHFEEGLVAAARKLGLPEEGNQEVLTLIQRLADELAAIEALRDRYIGMRAMEQKIQTLRQVTKSHQVVIELLEPLARLMTTAVKRYRDAFGELDAQTGEILSLLKNAETQTSFLRERRNALHRSLLAWDEILDAWAEAEVQGDNTDRRLLRETYRFLAPRFMQLDEWVLKSQAQAPAGGEVDLMEAPKAGSKRKTEMSW